MLAVKTKAVYDYQNVIRSKARFIFSFMCIIFILGLSFLYFNSVFETKTKGGG